MTQERLRKENKSFHVVFFPLRRIPLRYILAAAHIHKGNVAKMRIIDNITCQTGTPKGILNSMATGDVKGIIESHTLKVPEGSFNIAGISSMLNIKGMDKGRENCWESVSLSTKEPTAAKSEA